MRNRNIIGLCLSYFAQSYGFYFYITWLPTYLEKARGFTAVRLGILAGLPLDSQHGGRSRRAVSRPITPAAASVSAGAARAWESCRALARRLAMAGGRGVQ